MNDKNQEGYMDLTASHAVRSVTRQEERNEVAACTDLSVPIDFCPKCGRKFNSKNKKSEEKKR